jgi:hypothetical protein
MKSKKEAQEEIWLALAERGFVTPLTQVPPAFSEWWKKHAHCPQRLGKGWTSGISAHKAWQCACYHEEFKLRSQI